MTVATESKPESLTRTTGRALGWNYAGMVTKMVLALGINALLARLLGPKPFGELAVGLIVFGFGNLFANVGLTSALIQKKDLRDVDVRFCFTCQMGIGALMTALVFATAPFWAGFFHDPGLVLLLRVFSILFVLQAFGTTSTALLNRKQDARTIQSVTIISYTVAYLGAGVGLALAGAGVWSLVAAWLTQAFVNSVLMYSRSRHSLLPLFRREHLPMLHFGVRILGANMCSWGISNLDNTVVGRVSGPVMLGYYSRAFSLTNIAENITSGLLQVLLPAFSRVQSEKEKLRRIYASVFGLLLMVLLPICAAVSATADVVMRGLYGYRWDPAIPYLRPIALAMAVNAVLAIAGPLLAARGKPHKELISQFISVVIALSVYVVAVHWSIALLSWCVLGVYLVRFAILTTAVHGEVGSRWRDLLYTGWPAFLLAGVSAATARGIADLLAQMPAVPRLLCVVAGTGAVMLACAVVFARGLLRPVLTMSPQLLTLAPAGIRSRLGMDALLQQEETVRVDERPLVVVASLMTMRVETGVQTHFKNFIDYLRERDREVVFVGPEEFKRPYLHLRLASKVFREYLRVNLETGYALLRRLDGYAMRRELKRRLAGRSAWRVYAQDPVSAEAALSLRANGAQKVVLAVHFNVSQAKEMADRGRLRRGGALDRRIREQERFVLEGVDCSVVFSSFMQRQLTLAGADAERMVQIPNTAFEPPVWPKHAGGDLIALGSLEPRKNQEFLLRVLAEAKARGHRYTLDLAGIGESAEALERLTGSLGIVDQVRFLGRVDDAGTLLKGYKLLVHAARIENMPIALIEALAAGLPIFAPEVGGIPEIVRDGVEGCYWDLEDVPGSTSLLIALMEDEDRRQRMAEAARARYLNKFEPSVVFGRLLNAIDGY